jgi:hypothetical protein
MVECVYPIAAPIIKTRQKKSWVDSGSGSLPSVIEGEFEDAEGAEAVGFSHGDFGFVIQA